MPNAYNTSVYREYVENYAEDFPLVDRETEAFTLHGLSATMTTHTYEKQVVCGSLPNGTPTFCLGSRTTAELTVTDRGGVAHTFALTDRPLRPIPLTLGGRDLILFRRNLYGYTLLDADDLATPLLDYFPSAVLGGEEMFIFCYAHPFGDLIVLEGCYWAVSYGRVFILDPATGRVLNLNETAGILDVFENTVTATDDVLTLRGSHTESNDDLDHDDEGVAYAFTLSNIHDLLDMHGQTDL